MENGTEKYIETIQYLEKLYEYCNGLLFEGKLKKPVITVQCDDRNKSNGWWTRKKVWKTNEKDEGEHELNITAQQLNRPVSQIAATMIHEMCHQYATVYDLQDTSRSGTYHNKLFKRIAEKHGLRVECVRTIGWSHTELTDETAKVIDKFVTENGSKIIYRSPVFKGQAVRSSSTRKYVCPICANSVRATKAVNIICADCNEPMQEEQ